MITSFLKQRTSLENWDLSLYDVPAASECFWNGFQYHFPIFNFYLSRKFVLGYHLYNSLRYYYRDQRRTDQILLYLIRIRAFEEGELLFEWRT